MSVDTRPQMLQAGDLSPADEELLDLLQRGRITAPYAASEIDYSLQYIRDRLGRLVEHGNAKKIYDGLYELVEDPRAQSHDKSARGAEKEAESRTQTPGVASEEPEENTPERPSEPESHFDRGEIVDAVESVAENWDDNPDRLDTRKFAAASVLEHAIETGEAVGRSSEIVEEVQETHPVEDQNEETYWRKNIRPVLKEHGQYNPGKHGYIVDMADL